MGQQVESVNSPVQALPRVPGPPSGPNSADFDTATAAASAKDSIAQK